MPALVTDAHLRSVLAAIRGLGKAGYEVIVAAQERLAAGFFSRHAGARLRPGEPGASALAARVAELAEGDGPIVFYPGQESSIDALLAGDPALPPGARVPYPDLGALRALRDKRELAALAAQAGLASPATLAEVSAGELAGWDPPAVCVVKPAGPGGALPTSRVIHTGEELRALVASLPPQEPLLVQERARAPLVSVSVVLAPGGELAARFQQEARRTWPLDAGTSTLAVSVPPDEPLVERCAGMLRDAGFGGMAQLQFVQVDRGPAIIDVNPRFYGSLPLALACGVNLPAAWHASLTGGPRHGPSRYTVGVSYRWLEGELLGAVRGAGGRAEAVRRAAEVMLRPPPRPRTGAVWAADDPLPGIVMGARLAARIAARRVGAA